MGNIEEKTAVEALSENVLAVRVINKSGPGGLAGHVRLLVRTPNGQPPATDSKR